MRPVLTATLTALILTAAARAHFVFLLPATDGTKATAVLSDELEPDPAVDIAKIAPTKLFVRAAGGADALIAWTKGEHEYAFAVPGQGARVIHGTTDYGVMTRGAAKPFLLRYHPKAVLGDVAAAKPLGAAPVEIVPEGGSGNVRFHVLAGGQPLADAEVTVLQPGGQSKKVRTDAAGRTPTFSQVGRYGAWARYVVATAGAHNGKAYDEERHYATLVVDVGR